jgi:hypothetical protein
MILNFTMSLQGLQPWRENFESPTPFFDITAISQNIRLRPPINDVIDVRSPFKYPKGSRMIGRYCFQNVSSAVLAEIDGDGWPAEKPILAVFVVDLGA